MDQERWKKIKPILDDALAAGTAGRTAFLVKACGGDEGLLGEVLEFLELEHSEADPLDQPAHSYLFSANGKTSPGDLIDKYKIISELGTGGMGSVYFAERVDGAYTQKIALKVIKEGITSSEILARFINERQILATLQHDHIAHLIDGGTTNDGRPFIAMEYVEGTPVTDFISENNLGLNDRLELFTEICSAVSFAHKNLIIHRDLKPSNILVTKKGVPKLLDFGIAKLLPAESSEIVPATQRFIFTPEYASPEQVRGETLTTATDIYSLGVILYELLAGRRPYPTDGSNISQIIHVVCESEPAPPSRTLVYTASDGCVDAKPKTLDFAPQLRGDLDNIVLKALRKEPERRYSSVDQFSEDIRRYLDGQPVIASADTWRYRTAKFIRRHRVAAAGAILVFISLLIGLGATVYQARIARAERAKAEKRFNDVRQLANSFVFEINDEIDKSPIKARALLVHRAIEYLDSLSAESSGDDSLTAELAAAYEKIGDVQAEIFNASLGNAGGALESHNKALGLRTQLFEKSPNDVQRGIDLAKSYQKVGNILTVTGDIKSAEENYRDAVAISEKVASLDPADVNVRKQLSNSYITLGQAILRSGSLSESLKNYSKGFEINRKLVLDDPTNSELVRRQAVTYSYIGYVRMLMGNYEQAVGDFENALDIERSNLEIDPANLRFRRNASVAYLWVGIGYREAGRLTESLANIKKSLVLEQTILDSDKQNYGEQNSMADCWAELAMTSSKSSNYAEAIHAFQTAIGQYSAVAANDQNNLSALAQIQLARRMLADTLGKQGQNREALKKYEESLAVLTDLATRDPGNLEWKYELAECRVGMGRALRALNDRAGATENYRTALPIFESLSEVSPENVKYRNGLNEIRDNLAALTSA